MAIKELTTDEIDALVGQRHAVTGVAYPPNGLQPYYHWLMRTLELLSQSCAGQLRIAADDATPTTVRIAPGTAVIGGEMLSYAGGTVDLASYNNDTALMWLYDDAGSAAIDHADEASGWPAEAHIKLAQVTLDAGAITVIVDRRTEQFVRDSHARFHYTLQITDQGDTSDPTRVQIQLHDAQGSPVALADYLRVRVCDEDGYTAASNATIAAAGDSTAAEVITANKDLVLRSDDDGFFELDVTNAAAETVTLRLGAAPMADRAANHAAALNITHV